MSENGFSPNNIKLNRDQIMTEKHIRNIAVITALVFVAFLQSCYYDNEEDLYPTPPECDTVDVSYSQQVWPIINSNCTGCHSGGAPQGNVSLENYDDIVIAANNGSLLGVIKHEDGWSPMPKGGGKLSDCNIAIIENWVNDGTPDN
jgi:hypothetical protein